MKGGVYLQSTNTKRLIYVAICAAMAYVVARATVFPIFPSAPFLKMHFGEVPLLLLALLGSPLQGLWSLLVKELISLFIGGSNPLGLASDFLLCGIFLVTTAAVFHGDGRSRRGLQIGALAGSMLRMLLAIPVNLIILRLQYGTGPAGVWIQMPYILPFNFIKSAADCLCVYFLYTKVSKPLMGYLTRQS